MVYGLGSESDSLPAFMVMTDGGISGRNSKSFSSGFLPAIYQGTLVRTEGSPIMNLAPPPYIEPGDQRMLLDSINDWNRQYAQARSDDTRLNARISNYELAFRMQMAAPELIDISKEPEHVRSPPPAHFSADVTLPMEIYTADGSAIPKGRSFIEIRSQGDESRLVFLRERKTIAVVKGRPYKGAADFTLPIVGTILLRPPAPAKTETEKDADKNQVSYLANIAWTATLRLYRTPNPANHEIHAVFRRGRRQLEFQLFSAPLAKPSTP